MAEQKCSDRDRTQVRPTLLLAVGPHARLIANETLVMSRTWLGAEPPLVVLTDEELGKEQNNPATQHEKLIQTCDELVNRERMEALRLAGSALLRTDEMQAWLLLDVDGAAPVETAAATLAWITQFAEQLSEVVWQRLRIPVIHQTLLLAEPAHQEQILLCGTQLCDAGLGHIYVSSPVTQEHFRLAPAQWHQMTATALAVLLWHAWPNHSQLENTNRQKHIVITLGGAVWRAPTPALQEWLILRTSQALVRRLLNDAKARVRATPNGFAAPQLPQSEEWRDATALAQADAELASLLPPTVSTIIRHGRHPGWSILATLSKQIVDEAKRHQERRQIELQQIRRHWLATRMTQWEATRQKRIAERLDTTAGEPTLAEYQEELAQLMSQVQATARMVDEQLDKANQQLTKRAAQVQQAERALDALCQQLPSYTPRGICTTILSPWRWISYGWMYFALLPQKTQRLQEVLAAYEQSMDREAAWHVMRQAYLGMVQDVHQEMVCLATVQERFTRLAAQWEQQLVTLEGQIGEVLPTLTLQQLWRDYLPNGRQTAESSSREQFITAFPTVPLHQWATCPEAELAEELLRWGRAVWIAVDTWSALDCLAISFVTDHRDEQVRETIQSGAKVEMTESEHWLNQFLRQALPLWPDESITDLLPQERWLLAPLGVGSQQCSNERNVQSPSGLSVALLDSWRNAYPDVLWGVSAGNNLFVLQWQAIHIQQAEGGMK